MPTVCSVCNAGRLPHLSLFVEIEHYTMYLYVLLSAIAQTFMLASINPVIYSMDFLHTAIKAFSLTSKTQINKEEFGEKFCRGTN